MPRGPKKPPSPKPANQNQRVIAFPLKLPDGELLDIGLAAHAYDGTINHLQMVRQSLQEAAQQVDGTLTYMEGLSKNSIEKDQQLQDGGGEKDKTE